MAKIKETDNVCGCQSFLLILSPDKDACYYFGHPAFVSLFFSTGIAKDNFHTRVNVREVNTLNFNIPWVIPNISFSVCSLKWKNSIIRSAPCHIVSYRGILWIVGDWLPKNCTTFPSRYRWTFTFVLKRIEAVGWLNSIWIRVILMGRSPCALSTSKMGTRQMLIHYHRDFFRRP